jgi:hypothetical protein
MKTQKECCRQIQLESIKSEACAVNMAVNTVIQTKECACSSGGNCDCGDNCQCANC